MAEQLYLFPTDGPCNFELKRAAKVHRRENNIGKVDLIVQLPHLYSDNMFLVSRTTGGRWFCQSCHPDINCQHIKALKLLLRLRSEAGYTGISEAEFLKQVLPVGQIKK